MPLSRILFASMISCCEGGKGGKGASVGSTVTPGYFENPEATREVLEPDGWFHTGDLGTIDPDGSLKVVGRKRDIFYCLRHTSSVRLSRLGARASLPFLDPAKRG